MEEKVVEILIGKGIRFSGHSIQIQGTTYKKTELGDVLGPEILEEAGFISDFYKEYRNENDRKRFWVGVFTACKRKVSKQQREIFRTESLPESTAQVIYTPVINIETNETVLVNPDTLEISLLSYEVWLRTMSPDDKAAVAHNQRLAKFVYDPYDISTFVMTDFENYKLLKVNTYLPPVWRKRSNCSSECPPSLWKILNHVFPNEEALEYILDWLYYALVSRNEAYLVLNGAKGVGKGVFCSIVKMLVGITNYTEAPDSFANSDFNAALDQKRVIVLDEIKVDKQKHTKLKRYINRFQNIEKKGKDADKSIETFNSFIITNNDETDMYLEYDDRRFSAIDLNASNLTEVISINELKKLDKEMEQEESELAYQFGYFIFNRKAKKYDEFSVFKGEKYHSLIQTSLRQWQKFILEKILEGYDDLLDINRLKREYKMRDGRLKFPSEVQKIQDFLNNYRYGGDKKLGEVVKEDGDWCIRVNPELLNDNLLEDDTQKDGDLL